MDKAHATPTKTATMPAMITVRAEQGTIVIKNDAMNRSRFGNCRMLMMAGTLQPSPSTMGISACPCMPT